MEESVRIDKWLWAVRVYPTRSIATEECKKGRITIGGVSVKPSRVPKIDEVIQVKKNPVNYSFKVINITGKRVGAKLVPHFMEDITPTEELKLLENQHIGALFTRDRGTGRPTKKDRRELNGMMDW